MAGYGTLGFSSGFGTATGAGITGSATPFGAPATTQAAPQFNFGSFGSSAPSTMGTSTGLVGFGGSSAPATAPGSTFFGGLGASTTATNTGFGLGSSTFGTSTAPTTSVGTGFNFGSGFGTTATSGTQGFGFGGGLNTGLGGGFGLGTSGAIGSQPFSLASTIGKPAGTLSFGGVGQPVAGIPAAPGIDQSLANFTAALFCPVLYGDERDTIIAKWNRLQAYWGTGKGFYAVNAPPVDFTPENPFCKFKAVGFSCLPSSKNEEGFVALMFNRKDVDIRSQQAQVVESLHRLLGSRPTISVCVEGVKPAVDNKSEVTVYIIERTPTGVSRRIPSNEVFAFLNQATMRQQLSGLGVETVISKAAPTVDQVRQYLENPVAGIDQLIWQQARLDNPDPDHLIPVPMLGFSDLHKRLKCQEEETKVHHGRLNVIANELNELCNNHTNAIAKIGEQKRKHLELSHRILKVMVRQEIARKLGLAVQVDEEQLRAQLEAIHTELSAPNQAKGRLNELMSQIRLQKEHNLLRTAERFTIDPALQHEIKQHIKRQQESLSHLMSVVREDLEAVSIMLSGLKMDAHSRK